MLGRSPLLNHPFVAFSASPIDRQKAARLPSEKSFTRELKKFRNFATSGDKPASVLCAIMSPIASATR